MLEAANELQWEHGEYRAAQVIEPAVPSRKLEKRICRLRLFAGGAGMITERMQHAFHEAGHLTIAYMLMRRNAAIGGALIYKKADEGSSGATFIMPRRKIAEKILNTYHLAGIFAEALALNDGKPVIAWPDEDSELYRRAAGDIEDLDAEAIECAGWFAEDFLRRCWPFVCAVARKIERDGLIVPRELHAIYRRFHPRRMNQ